MEILFSMPMLLLYSVLFGVTMKVADLFNEHGLAWLKGSDVFFGILFGLFGGILIMSTDSLTNLWLALLLANIFRFRVDSLNHGIAAVLMFISFLVVKENLEWVSFLYFFITFSFFGLLMDTNLIPHKFKIVENFLEFRTHYFIFTFLFSLFSLFSF